MVRGQYIKNFANFDFSKANTYYWHYTWVFWAKTTWKKEYANFYLRLHRVTSENALMVFPKIRKNQYAILLKKIFQLLTEKVSFSFNLNVKLFKKSKKTFIKVFCLHFGFFFPVVTTDYMNGSITPL